MTTQQTDIDKALVALLVDDICGDIHDNVIKQVTKKYVHKAIVALLADDICGDIHDKAITLVREKQHTVHTLKMENCKTPEELAKWLLDKAEKDEMLMEALWEIYRYFENLL
jgi:hypothetical protein